MNTLDKIQTLQNIKEDIKTSIQSKGVEVGDDFTTYANAIYSIEGGSSSDGGGVNVVELTQEEYDNLGYKDSNTFYVITDAPAIDTSEFATKTDLSNALGDIETILDNIIGDTNGGGGNGPSIFPL